MQETLNFPTKLPARNGLIGFSNPNFPTQSPTQARLRPFIFAALSSKSATTTTAALPAKPSKFLQFPPSPSPSPATLELQENCKSQNVVSTPDPEFQEKALFLDSIGLDCISLLSKPNSPATAAAIAAASLADLRALFEYLGSFELSGPDLRRVVSMCPEILSLRLKDVVPVFTFLLGEAKVAGADLRRVICRRPRLLVSNVETRLRPTLYFLQSIGIHEVNRHTNLLSSSVEDKFIPKIEYFEKVGFCYRDSISMFRRFPPLFCYSVKENFEPKFNYFVVEMGRDLKELKEFPQYFSFSLERRIKPRHQICVENGVCFPLPVMLKMKEEVFRQKLDVCCNSSMPRSTSPLWCANTYDVNTL